VSLGQQQDQRREKQSRVRKRLWWCRQLSG
jgi:hypothetical protein